MSPALCARMPRLGPAASCSPSLARLPVDVLTASPVRLSMASRCIWSTPVMSLPSQARCLCPRGVLSVQAGRCHVADKQGCWMFFGRLARGPARRSGGAARSAA